MHENKVGYKNTPVSNIRVVEPLSIRKVKLILINDLSNGGNLFSRNFYLTGLCML